MIPSSRPPRPALDPELEAALVASGGLEIVSLTPERIAAERRTEGVDRPTLASLQAIEGVDADEATVPGPCGDVVVAVLRPSEPDPASGAARPTTGLRPGVLHVHGGGMVLGTRFWDLDEPLTWVHDLGAVVVSPEYRRAPEHPHPAPVEDCWAALAWTVDNAAELGVDPARIVVAGVSAGGGIAAGLSLMARDRGGPALAGTLLRCPMLDDRSITPSSAMLVGELVWDGVSNDTGWDALLGTDRGGEHVSPYASPARAQDLSALPPTYVDVGSADAFRDEDVDHALRLWRAGGDAELHVWPGAFHVFENIAPDAALTLRARQARARWLERVLTPR